ncbi:MAG: methionine--tRNA ligase [Longimicrobiales bacterium]
MIEKDIWYITTAIDYANGPPHMGHAVEKIGADVMARYRRLKGERVHFVIGTDEHGVKVLQSAQAAGVSPQEWVDGVAARFRATWDQLDISYDDFIRTTEPRHTRAAQEIVRRMRANGDLYRGRYEGYYCVGCEAFKRDDELIVDETGARRCPLHRTRSLEWTEEENWFFRLSVYQDRLLKLYDERPEFLQPQSRMNEMRRLVEGGLEDISISRAQLAWGVPWPAESDEPDTVVYVWVEALINYLSATGFPDGDWQRLWPADVHVIGKDITRFHSVYWPAMLMSADIALPRAVWAHGFVTFGGGKLSKSEGVQVELADAIERHGADAFRYYLLRDVPWNGDGEFSWERFDARYNAELADDIGNLASRTTSMILRYRGGIVPARADAALDAAIAAALVRYRGAMDGHLLHHGIQAALELASAANGFVETQAPWALAKDEARAAELDATLAALARTLAALATLLYPFMPEKAAALAQSLSLEAPPALDEVAALDPGGLRVVKGPILFPKPAR